MAAREEIRMEEFAEPISHYTDAVRFGNILFISEIAPLNKAGEVVGKGDVVEQTRQIFRGLKAILDQAGAGFGDVLKVTVYLTDVNDRQAINTVRKEYFGEARPASTLFGVAALALPDMKVEIEAVVGLPS